MPMNVTGSEPITTQDRIGVGTNATVPQVGSPNWRGSRSDNSGNQDPPGFWDSLGPTLSQSIGQVAGTLITALLGFLF